MLTDLDQKRQREIVVEDQGGGMLRSLWSMWGFYRVVELLYFFYFRGNHVPHDLATTNGQTAMMFSGAVPWHGLGTALDEPPTAEEAITAAGLDYRVTLEPLQTECGEPVPQRRAVVRGDTQAVLGVVGRSYRPVQNVDCFSFLDEVVEGGDLRYETAGALGQGERVWMLAKMPGEIRVKNSDDVTDRYLLLTNSHDGSSALRCHFTPIRVVCKNTMVAAERRNRGRGVSIIHKGDLSTKVTEAREILGLAHRFYDGFAMKIDLLASHFPTSGQLIDYFEELYPDGPETKNRRAKNVREELLRLFEHGKGNDLPEIRLTTWAAFNAVTEWVDHYRPSRGRTSHQRADRRLHSAWFGTGARLKERAWAAALNMAS